MFESYFRRERFEKRAWLYLANSRWPFFVDHIAPFFGYSIYPKGSSLLEKKEIMMAQSNQHKKSRLGHWAKVVVMFLSFGFIFPHALTEDEDTDIGKPNTLNEAMPKKP
jgi:hypothetical protein